MHARARARWATSATLLTGVAIAIVASRAQSPFTPPLPPGTEASWPLRGSLSILGIDRLSRGAVAALGAAVIFAAAGAFLYSLGRAWRSELSIRRVVAVALLLHVLALAMPVFLSRDVYSYGFYGRMVSRYGANPYTDIPAQFYADPAYPFVSVDWIDSPSVYGPAFTSLSAGVTSVTSTPEQEVLAFKVLAVLASVATLLLVISAARRLAPERTVFAAALIGWNPVVIFHGVAGAHNDALLGLALSAGVLAVIARRELWATAILALGTLVKVSGGVPLVMAVVAAAVRTRRRRLSTFARHAGIAALVALPFVIPFFQTEDPTLGTLELATRQGWLAPSRFVLSTLRGAARAVGGETAADVVGLIVRVAFPLVFVWVLVMLVRHLARDPDRIEPGHVVAAMGWAGVVSLLVSPVLLPWYMAWVLPLAWLLPRPARGGAVLLSLALAITELVAEPARSPGLYEAMVFGLHWVATPVILLVLVRLVLDLRRRVALGPRPGREDPLLAEEPVTSPASERVSGDGQDRRDGHGSGAAGKEPDAVGSHGGEDRDRDPD
ncbi:MAG: polyprenol phosphomannose-dependent alpha 1,6 mannosyltransferase MptB [Actinomycetota bacterium]